MRLLQWSVSAPWLLAAAIGCAHGGEADFPDTLQLALPSVVHIAVGGTRQTRDPSLGDAPTADALAAPMHRGPRMAGSGIVVGADGYIVTVAYLFDSGEPVVVRLSDGRQFPAKVVGKDRRSGIAVLKIDATGLGAAKIGDPRKVRLAERVVAIGALPSGISATVTDGIVSVMSMQPSDPAPFMQFTAPLYPGMGGGALINRSGEVIGINSMIYSRSSGTGLSFAVPIDYAMSIATELRANGRVRRGAIGLTMQEISTELAAGLGLAKGLGVVVASVEKGMPAAQAGITTGDVILRVAGEPVRSPAQLAQMVAGLRPGNRISIDVQRGKQSQKFDVTVADAGD